MYHLGTACAASNDGVGDEPVQGALPGPHFLGASVHIPCMPLSISTSTSARKNNKRKQTEDIRGKAFPDSEITPNDTWRIVRGNKPATPGRGISREQNPASPLRSHGSEPQIAKVNKGSTEDPVLPGITTLGAGRQGWPWCLSAEGSGLGFMSLMVFAAPAFSRVPGTL